MIIILAQLVDLLPPVEFFHALWATPVLAFGVMWFLQRRTPSRGSWLVLIAYCLLVGLWLCGRSLPGASGALLNVCLMLLVGPAVAAGFVVAGLRPKE